MYKPYEDEKWYFFTTRDRKHKIGDRVDRFAGNGYWRRSGGGKDVVSDGSKIGKKEHFVFYIGKPPSGLRTDWNIYKYKRATTRRKKEDGEAIEHNLEGQVHPSEENNNNEPALRQSRKKRRIDLSGLCNNGNGTKSYSNKPAATDELDIFEDFTAPTILSPNPFGGSTIPPTNGNNPLYLELMIEHEAANHRTTTQQQHPDNQQGPTNS
ncbi:NAC domain containing protein [Trema orientale]|uniref:NAC domain containing protein n=1 Tax=Trema orientale TaxID=63057 RepID=A0A2P5EF43_TREOI|nr:NAC domain containing protein [Trema orientale]